MEGTLDLWPVEDRRRVMGVIVNRFREDPQVFESGVTEFEALAGVPVLRVVPHLADGVDEGDRPEPVDIDTRAPAGMLRVGALLSPRVSKSDARPAPRAAA